MKKIFKSRKEKNEKNFNEYVRTNNGELKELYDSMSEKEKLRAIISGYDKCDLFWGCQYRCSTTLISNNELDIILEVMNKYNLTYKDFLTLYRTYWKGNLKKYKNKYGKCLSELESIFQKYESYNKKAKTLHDRKKFFPDDNVGVKEILKSIEKNHNNEIEKFIVEYNLDESDYITLAKTELHKGFISQQLVGASDKLVPDLEKTLTLTLGKNNYNRFVKQGKLNHDKYWEQ